MAGPADAIGAQGGAHGDILMSGMLMNGGNSRPYNR
jgi:hypothetical protein